MRCVRADVLEWEPARRYGLWHDRAVLHFLVDEEQRSAYLATLQAALEPGGAIVIGTFANDGPATCSGLPVRRYSADELVRALGPTVDVVVARRHTHVTPRGVVQPFTWVAGRLA